MRVFKQFLTILFIFVITVLSVSAQTAAFTYQGRLADSAAAANGTYQMQFSLYDSLSGGTQQGSTITNNTVTVTNGIFTVQLDFSPATPFATGADRWIEIAVRKAADPPGFTTLTPRQPVTSAPYSVRSLNSATADNAANLGGVAANQYVVTTDPRMTDARSPAAGSSNYIQNTTIAQNGSNFNISGSGTAGNTLLANIVDATTQYNLNGNRVLSVSGVGAFVNTNTFTGFQAGSMNTPDGSGQGSFNSFYGYSAGSSNSTGSFNNFFGYSSGNSNTSGVFNSFFGDSSGRLATTSSSNSFFGRQSGFHTTTGGYNSFFGQSSGLNNDTGIGNSFFGNEAGVYTTTGSTNSFFGALAGSGNTTGTNNAAFGSSASFGSNNLTNSTAIGANARVDESNALILGSINGINAANADTSVGIGTTQPGVGEAARFAILQRQQNQWSQHIRTNGFASGSFGLLIDAGTNSGDRAFRVRSQSGADIFSIRGDGNVGMGTDSPTTKLHIADGNTGGTSLVLENSSVGRQIFLSMYGSVGAGNYWPGVSSANTSSLLGSSLFVLRSTGGLAFSGSNTAEHMRILANGNVGINTNSPSFTLDVNGSLRVGAVSGGGITSVCLTALGGVASCSSSLRYKTNIGIFQYGLNVINRLKPITFEWKEGGMHDLGLGAEDVAEIEPLLVTYNKDGQVEGVKYDRIGVVLVNAVKEQQAQIEAQQNQIELQRKQIESLTKIVCETNSKAEICRQQER